MSWNTTILTGTGIVGVDGFCEAIRSSDMQIGDWAKDILGQPAFSVVDKEIKIDLSIMSLAELGFGSGAHYNQICESLGRFSLKKCPAEIGPQMRLQYPNQPKGEWLIVFMNPIIASDDNLRIFHVGHNDRGRWLVGDLCNLDHMW